MSTKDIFFLDLYHFFRGLGTAFAYQLEQLVFFDGEILSIVLVVLDFFCDKFEQTNDLMKDLKYNLYTFLFYICVVC